jgi:hypothetical protein
LVRYLNISDAVSVLVAYMSKKRIDKQLIGILVSRIKPDIVDLVSIAKIDQKFYSEVEPPYALYVKYIIEYSTKQKARYAGETTLEIWEIIQDALIKHGVINIKGS